MLSHGNLALVQDNEEHFSETALALPELKEKLGGVLLSLEQLRPPEGVPTGIDVIDNFLLWRGFPKGDLTLLCGEPGTGATSLWVHAAANAQSKGKWAAWINSDWELLPSYLVKKKIDLKKLLVVEKPASAQQLFWMLQELITSSLFETVGVHLQDFILKTHQLKKLKKLARTHQVGLVFVGAVRNWLQQPLFSLTVDCARDFFTIRRALHRPTPFTIAGGAIHADLMSQLTASARTLLR